MRACFLSSPNSSDLIYSDPVHEATDLIPASLYYQVFVLRRAGVLRFVVVGRSGGG